jgi:hypothetical protein
MLRLRASRTPHVFANTPAEAQQGIPLLVEALRLDPDYAYAYALLSGAHAQIFRSAAGQQRADAQKKPKRMPVGLSFSTATTGAF